MSDPFSLFGTEGAPSPERPVLTPALERVEADLVDDLGAHRPLMLVTGAPGIGKTTVLLRVRARLQSSTGVCYAGAASGPCDKFFERICAELGLAVDSPGPDGARDALRGFVRSQRMRAFVLLVDDAHALTDEILADVAGFLPSDETEPGPVQVVLAGEPELEGRLARLERVPATEEGRVYRLSGLAPHEVGEYVASMLSAHGDAFGAPFTPAAIERIAHHSAGVPKAVNMICGCALEIARGQDADVVTGEMIDDVVADLGAIIEQPPQPAPAHEPVGRRKPGPRRERLKWRMGAAAALAGLAAGVWVLVYEAPDEGPEPGASTLLAPAELTPASARASAGPDQRDPALGASPTEEAMAALEAKHMATVRQLERALEAARARQTRLREQKAEMAELRRRIRELEAALASASPAPGAQTVDAAPERVKDSERPPATGGGGMGPSALEFHLAAPEKSSSVLDRGFSAPQTRVLRRPAMAPPMDTRVLTLRQAAPEPVPDGRDSGAEGPEVAALEEVAQPSPSPEHPPQTLALAPSVVPGGDPSQAAPEPVRDGRDSGAEGPEVAALEEVAQPSPSQEHPPETLALAPSVVGRGPSHAAPEQALSDMGSERARATRAEVGKPPQRATGRPEHYVVRRGDTLVSIAQKFSVSVPDLIRWNALSEPDHLSVGRRLRLTGPPGTLSKLDAALLEAAKEGRTDEIRTALRHGARLDARSRDGKTALMYAAASGHRDAVALLLEHGPKLDAKDRSGDTALMHAAWNGHAPMLRLLLKAGAGVNVRNDQSWTALMYAAINGHVACAETLLEHGAAIDARIEDGRTALAAAAWNGQTTLVQRLLERGADVDSPDTFGRTPLMEATWNGHTKIAKLLLAHGADPRLASNDGRTALSIAQKRGYLSLAELLQRDARSGN